MLVRDVMNSRPVTVQANDLVGKAAKLMRENKISGMPVLDGDSLVGVVSESDLLKLLSAEDEEGGLWLPSPFELIEVPLRDLVRWERLRAGSEDVSKRTVSDVMSRSVAHIGPDQTIEDAAAAMTRHKINRLPVIENGKLVGIVTRGDIIAGLGGLS